MSNLNGHSAASQILNPPMFRPYSVTWIRNVNIQSGGLLALSYMWKVYALLALPLFYIAIAVRNTEDHSEDGLVAFLALAALISVTAFFLISGMARHSSVIVSDNEIMFSSWLGTTTWHCADIERCEIMAPAQSDRVSMPTSMALGTGLLLNGILAMSMLMNNDPFFWIVLLVMLICVALLPAMHYDRKTNVTVEISNGPRASTQPHTVYIRCRSGQARALAGALCKNRADRSELLQTFESI